MAQVLSIKILLNGKADMIWGVFFKFFTKGIILMHLSFFQVLEFLAKHFLILIVFTALALLLIFWFFTICSTFRIKVIIKFILVWFMTRRQSIVGIMQIPAIIFYTFKIEIAWPHGLMYPYAPCTFVIAPKTITTYFVGSSFPHLICLIHYLLNY